MTPASLSKTTSAAVAAVGSDSPTEMSSVCSAMSAQWWPSGSTGSTIKASTRWSTRP